jgi:hypothetical protein
MVSYEKSDKLNFEVSCEFHYSTCMKRLHSHPRHLTRASKLSLCKRSLNNNKFTVLAQLIHNKFVLLLLITQLLRNLLHGVPSIIKKFLALYGMRQLHHCVLQQPANEPYPAATRIISPLLHPTP